MPLSFPGSPSFGDQSEQNGRPFWWDGHAWRLVGCEPVPELEAVQYLVVAGGGGGAMFGGGGGGGVLSGSFYPASGQAYSITVGLGGDGDVDESTNGGNSALGSIATATGGGRGGSINNTAGFPRDGGGGGSGGGGSGRTTGTGGAGGGGTIGQGFGGGSGTTSEMVYNDTAGGGGGGASQAGGNGVAPVPGQFGFDQLGICGAGGDGVISTISGSSVRYGAGGGGGGGENTTAGGGGAGGGGSGSNRVNSATAGTGYGAGGGGGGYSQNYSPPESTGGAGGNGVVILRVPASLAGSVTTTGTPSTATNAGDTIYTFTANGSITF